MMHSGSNPANSRRGTAGCIISQSLNYFAHIHSRSLYKKGAPSIPPVGTTVEDVVFSASGRSFGNFFCKAQPERGL